MCLTTLVEQGRVIKLKGSLIDTCPSGEGQYLLSNSLSFQLDNFLTSCPHLASYVSWDWVLTESTRPYSLWDRSSLSPPCFFLWDRAFSRSTGSHFLGLGPNRVLQVPFFMGPGPRCVHRVPFFVGPGPTPRRAHIVLEGRGGGLGCLRKQG